MKRSTLLVLDCHYLCHRAYHSQGQLSHQGSATGVIFGFLKAVPLLKDEFLTDRIAFCFEGSALVRKRLYPEYKEKRNRMQRMTDEERKSYEGLAIQIAELRKRYLPQIGFKNVFGYHGLESDDVMAAIAKAAPAHETVILVTADTDMLQCLRPNVKVYSPQKQKLYTEEWFKREYGLLPAKWALVKAISGCSSDNVKGIEGVGEITALKFLRGELPESHQAYRKILSKAGKHIVRRNRELVQLPLDCCPTPTIREDEISEKGWQDVCRLLGMRSLSARLPVMTRKLHIYAKR